ncbi:flagellar protein FliS [Burkholderia ubonensis]|uniref:flagellar export chaperone FliS n=1 Tax=Burkholderia ubonensis TaxID=101571 RepID=UPI00075B2EF6|nr:flagellar export chaperone FliS [Burkholderia ubonensis]KVO87703.1 flagellar protein FliS [Burkholderia ubonensis]KVZ57320.1 flagellar protein FliS [Burkholderia ubonensis]KVZ73017.1 flagellar protein FliS [Burkholderia ubonensis]
MTHPLGYGNYCALSLDALTAGASPAQLVVVLMNSLLDEMARARAHIEAKRFEQKGDSIAKCLSMLNGLSSMLDFDAPGDTAQRLASLYEYCAWRLNESGLTLDPARVDDAASIVTTLRDAWAGVDGQPG